MTSIERTAYPHIAANKSISQKTLDTLYILTTEEFDYINQNIRGNRMQLNFAIQLKTFQNLRYFFDISETPRVIINHLRKQLKLPHNLSPFYNHPKTLSRHRSRIREYLKIIPWDTKKEQSAQRVAIHAAHKASQTLNHPADIINVVIEELIGKHFELPAFNTLDRLVRHVRSKVNQAIFQIVTNYLKTNNLLAQIDNLLIVEKEETYSAYQRLKQPPKAPTLTNFKEYICYNHWLMSLGFIERYLKDIAKVKLKQFAEEAKSLDIDNLKDLSEKKKYTLIACLIYQAQQMAKDTLGIFVCKTIFAIHKQGKKKLAILKEKLYDKMQDLAKLMLGIVGDYQEAPQQTKSFVSKFRKKIEDQGGFEEVADLCQKIIAYNSNNHIPFLWDYFRSKRSVLFNFLSALNICSSTQNKDIIRVLDFLAKNRYCRSDSLVLDENISLSFCSEKWKNFIVLGKPEDKIVSRRYLELGAFSYLANELRSGDLFIEGADAFSDYRHHLLSLEECNLLGKEYLQNLGFPKTAEEFVSLLQNNLLQMARKADKLYPQLPDFFISEEGIPVLKKAPTIKPSPKTVKIVEKIHHRMPERRLLDILCLTHHLTGWAYEFAHLSGAESRLQNPIERYILNVFCQGTGPYTGG